MRGDEQFDLKLFIKMKSKTSSSQCIMQLYILIFNLIEFLSSFFSGGLHLPVVLSLQLYYLNVAIRFSAVGYLLLRNRYDCPQYL